MADRRTAITNLRCNYPRSRTMVLPGYRGDFYCVELMKIITVIALLFGCFLLMCSKVMAVQSTNHMMTLDRYYYANCDGQECCFQVFPVPETYFFANDEAAWLWFNWRGADPGDEFTMLTFSPGGGLYDRMSSDALITREDGCLLLSFSINGSAPEHMPGDWRMEVAIDGDHLFSQSFKIVTGNRDTYIANKTMTLYPDTGGDCSMPPSNFVFYEFDEGAYFWFYFNSAGIGDDLRVDWYDPNGNVYLSETTPYHCANGCLYPGISISGHEAAHLPGRWRVTVYYDGDRYFNEYFTIVDTTADQPITCPLSLIYGDDSLQAGALRTFRDDVLRRTPEGRELIRLYYQWGPSVAQAIMADDQFREEAKELADAVLMMIAGEAQ